MDTVYHLITKLSYDKLSLAIADDLIYQAV